MEHHIAFGRGFLHEVHRKLYQHVIDTANKSKAGHTVVLSRASGDEKNPLTPEQKLKHARRALSKGANVQIASTEKPNILHHAADLHKKGVKTLHFHGGSDRKEMYELLKKYNGKEGKHGYFKFDNIHFHQYGAERKEGGKAGLNPADESSYSGTNIRKAAQANDRRTLHGVLPKTLSSRHKNELIDDIQSGLKTAAKPKKRKLTEDLLHSDFEPMMKTFSQFASQHLGLKNTPKINLKKPDEQDVATSFGGYNPKTKEILLQTKNRQPMDIFRTLAHELVHAKQHEDGKIGHDITKEGETGSEYENEANAKAGVIMRHFGKQNPNYFELKPLKEAVFVVGGPCCGKDRVVKVIKESYTNAYEMDVEALSRVIPKEDRIIISGPAHDLSSIHTANEMLKSLNYQTSMIFVDVENNISQLRNEERASRGQKVLNESIRFRKHKDSKNNIAAFKSLFNENFILIENNNDNLNESLHDWFKSKSPKTGARGWVQVGGKYDGYPCARQPGQTTTPKCRSSKERSRMSKKQKEYAFRKKQKEDPNQPQKTGGAKPTMVKTYKEEKDACYHKVKSRYDVFPSAYASGALVKCRKVGAANWGNKSSKKKAVDEDFEKYMADTHNREEGTDKLRKLYAKMTPGQFPDTIPTAGVNVYPTSLYEKEECGCDHKKPKRKIIRKRLAQEAENGSKLTTASGAVGLPVSDSIGPEFGVAKSPSIITGLTGVSPMSQGAYMSVYPFGTYGIAESVINWMNKPETQTRFVEKYGSIAEQKLIETGIAISKSMNTETKSGPKFFEHLRENWEALGGRDAGTVPATSRSKDNEVYEDSWSDTKYQNPKGGLTKAGVMKYRAENPGSKLQTAVRTKPSKLKKGSKSWKRRRSFCKRMTGMKKKLTSAKTARDPNSRINKSLRAWNCEE